jgi:SAM-dependent methyltransferase
MFSHFPLFQSHLDLAHHHWERLIQGGDTVIDATCGNGHDTLLLSRLALYHPLVESKGHVIGFDIQESAIQKTRDLLREHLQTEQLDRVQLIHGSHDFFPENIVARSVRLVVYNLGYLPGGNKQITTRVETTLASVKRAQELLMPGGAISLTCYPGHSEGQVEEEALLELVSSWEAREWSCCHHRWLNRRSAPSLLLIQRHG